MTRRTAVALSQSKSGAMVSLYATRRGAVGSVLNGTVEPFDFASKGGDVDVSIASLGYRRVGGWEPVAEAPGSFLARVEVSS